MKSQKNLPQTSTESHAVSRNISFSVLSDENLDRKIAQLNQSVDAALADHKTAERSAVEDAWALGQHLVEKKNRLKHGEFLPWLATTGIADSTANEFMMLARQITSVGDLGVSIRSSIRGLKPPPKPVTAVQPVPDEADTAEADTAEADTATIISGLEADLADSEERSAIMEEAASPESRKAIDKLNNQVELIKTLKSSVANAQAKNTDLKREIRSLKRKVKALELANSRQSV